MKSFYAKTQPSPRLSASLENEGILEGVNGADALSIRYPYVGGISVRFLRDRNSLMEGGDG